MFYVIVSSNKFIQENKSVRIDKNKKYLKKTSGGKCAKCTHNMDIS